jgi:hypothetical protein
MPSLLEPLDRITRYASLGCRKSMNQKCFRQLRRIRNGKRRALTLLGRKSNPRKTEATAEEAVASDTQSKKPSQAEIRAATSGPRPIQVRGSQ